MVYLKIAFIATILFGAGFIYVVETTLTNPANQVELEKVQLEKARERATELGLVLIEN